MAKQEPGDSAALSPRLAPDSGAPNGTIIDYLVTQRVIPSLVAEGDRFTADSRAASPEDLALLAARGNERALQAALAAELHRGHPVEEILGPTAAALGAFWEQDELNFSEVTMATARLQRWHRGQGDRIANAHRDRPARRILLATVPGEQHSLGLSLVASTFHEAGWAVEGGPGLSAAQLRAQLRMHWFDVLGLSLNTERALAPLATMIEDFRVQSKNGALLVVVGGGLVKQRPDLANALAVDAVFTAAQGAPETLLARLPEAAARS